MDDATCGLLTAMINDGVIMKPHPLSIANWDDTEIDAAIDVLRSGRVTMGDITIEYERRFADFVGTKYAVACNSGSSANLLMVAAWTLRYGKGTVIVPALGWPTSYAPFLQYGWKLRFVDCDRETLNYDMGALWKANENDDADLALAINILGNPNDFKNFPRRVRVLEDNCEALGAEYAKRRTGSWGEMSSHSTFFSHHICTIEGGVVTTNDEHFYQMLLSLRSHGWTRDLPQPNIFKSKGGKFDFVLPGYNVRPNELTSAIGLAQLDKLPRALEVRRANAKSFPLKTQKELGKSSWYGFAVFDDDVAMAERHCITRPVLTGNFLRSPSIKFYDYEVCGDTPNADYVADNAVMIGNHPRRIDWSFFDTTRSPVVPVSIGDLYDRISILEIKAKNVNDAAALENVNRELGELSAAASNINPSPEVLRLIDELRNVNAIGWSGEASVRMKAEKKEFDASFIQLVVATFKNNDRRAAIKKQINIEMRSRMIEEKTWTV